MVDGADLERRFCESKRGFESPSLRIRKNTHYKGFEIQGIYSNTIFFGFVTNA